jgi:hypothetical protein
VVRVSPQFRGNLVGSLKTLHPYSIIATIVLCSGVDAIFIYKRTVITLKG